MKNVSFGHLMFAGVSAAIATFCFYMAGPAFNEQLSHGAWLVAAGLLFSVLPALALIKILASKSELFARIDKMISPKPAETQGTSFGPNWVMIIGMTAIALVVVSVVMSVITSSLDAPSSSATPEVISP